MTGFVRFSDMAKCHVRFIYKPNAFLIILEAISRFWLDFHQFETGFIRFFDFAIAHVPKLKNTVRKVMILESIFHFLLKSMKVDSFFRPALHAAVALRCSSSGTMR